MNTVDAAGEVHITRSLSEALDRLGVSRTEVHWVARGHARGIAARMRTSESDHSAAAAIVGVGGGSAMDAARVAASNANIPAVLVPTSLSTDAAFSHVSAHRVEGSVQYLETGPAAAVVLDEALLACTDVALHARGVADVFAILTSSIDCALANPTHMARADEAAALLEPLTRCAEGLASGEMQAVLELARLMRLKIAIGVAAGHPFFEEGTEHYLAYLAEGAGATGRLHGDLLWGGIRACQVLQPWTKADRSTYATIRDAVGPFFSPVVTSRSGTERYVRMLAAAPRALAQQGLTNTVLLSQANSEKRLRKAGLAFAMEGMAD